MSLGGKTVSYALHSKARLCSSLYHRDQWLGSLSEGNAEVMIITFPALSN